MMTSDLYYIMDDPEIGCPVDSGIDSYVLADKIANMRVKDGFPRPLIYNEWNTRIVVADETNQYHQKGDRYRIPYPDWVPDTKPIPESAIDDLEMFGIMLDEWMSVNEDLCEEITIGEPYIDRCGQPCAGGEDDEAYYILDSPDGENVQLNFSAAK